MGRARSYVIAAAISLASVLVFNANGRYIGTQDTEGTALVPVVLNRDASLRMDEFQAHFERDTWTYFFRETSYGVLPSFPIATGLLLAPFYALPVHWYSARSPDTTQWVRFSRIMAKLSASAIAGLAVGVFFLLALALGATGGRAALGAVAFAVTSELWSNGSQALWQHGPGSLFLLLGALLSLRQHLKPQRSTALLFGLCAALAVAIRPMNALGVAPLTVWIVLARPSHWRAYALLPVVIGAALLAYNLAVFGDVRGLYAQRLDTPILEGLAGVLWSPARGLFVYFPVAILGLLAMGRVLRRGHPNRAFYAALSVFVVAHLLLVSSYYRWWGGYCYGPRLLSEIQPALLLLALPLLDSGRLRNTARMAFTLCFAWGLFVQAVGAWVYPNGGWDHTPEAIDRAPERLWDWRDNPIARNVLYLRRPALQDD